VRLPGRRQVGWCGLAADRDAGAFFTLTGIADPACHCEGRSDEAGSCPLGREIALRRFAPRNDRGVGTHAHTSTFSEPGVSYVGRQSIKQNYLKLFASAANIRFGPIERFASSDRVFDDMWARFTLAGDGFENAPVPIGTKVKLRLLHNFHIRDGLIAREIGYEIWLRDE